MTVEVQLVGVSIAEAIDPDQELIPIQRRFRFDDGTAEVLIGIHSWDVGDTGPYWTWSWRSRTSTFHPAVPAHLSLRVLRAQEGTEAVPHADGATVIWLDE